MRVALCETWSKNSDLWGLSPFAIPNLTLTTLFSLEIGWMYYWFKKKKIKTLIQWWSSNGVILLQIFRFFLVQSTPVYRVPKPVENQPQKEPKLKAIHSLTFFDPIYENVIKKFISKERRKKRKKKKKEKERKRKKKKEKL